MGCGVSRRVTDPDSPQRKSSDEEEQPSTCCARSWAHRFGLESLVYLSQLSSM